MTSLLLAGAVLVIIGVIGMIEDTIDVRNSPEYREYSMVGPAVILIGAVLVAIDLWIRFGP